MVNRKVYSEINCVHLFNNKCLLLLDDFMLKINKQHIGTKPNITETNHEKLSQYDFKTKNHRIEKIGTILRKNMSSMKKLK